VISDQWVLKLDYDRHDAVPTLTRACALLRRAGYRCVWWAESISPSGRGRHVTVKLRPRPTAPMEIVALQAVLGSDPFREACNTMRVRALPEISSFWQRRWNVFYRKG
jgi:hypothetical protein